MCGLHRMFRLLPAQYIISLLHGLTGLTTETRNTKMCVHKTLFASTHAYFDYQLPQKLFDLMKDFYKYRIVLIYQRPLDGGHLGLRGTKFRTQLKGITISVG